MSSLICGVSGQEGAYLTQHLLSKGYRVVGTSRDAQMGRHENLRQLGVAADVDIVSMALNDFRSVLQVLAQVRPEEAYNLAGQSSVSLSFEQPVETVESISAGTLDLLEGIRFFDPAIRLYSAGSSECFSHSAANVAMAMATTRLGWTAQHSVEDVVQEMCEAVARRAH